VRLGYSESGIRVGCRLTRSRVTPDGDEKQSIFDVCTITGIIQSKQRCASLDQYVRGCINCVSGPVRGPARPARQGVYVALDRRTGESRGYATVRFAGPAGPLAAATNATDRAVALSGRPLFGPDGAGPAGTGIRVSYSLSDWAPLAASSGWQPAAESRTVAVTGLPGNATAAALRAAYGPAEAVHWSRALRTGRTGRAGQRGSTGVSGRAG
jgi:hypothetical protein